MSKDKQINFIVKNILIILGTILFFLFLFILNKFFFSQKIYKDLPENIGYFLEFDKKFVEKINPEFFGNKIPWFFPFSSKIDDKMGVFSYKGELFTSIYTFSERNSLKLLKKFSLNENIKEKGIFFISETSQIPKCIHKGNILICGKNEKFLEEIKNDKTKLLNNSNFLKVLNNLPKNNFFGFINFKEIKNSLISKKINSAGISFKNGEGIIFGNLEKNYKNFLNKNPRKIFFEKFIDFEKNNFIFSSRNLDKKIENIFKNFENRKLKTFSNKKMEKTFEKYFGFKLFGNKLLKSFKGENFFSFSEKNFLIGTEIKEKIELEKFFQKRKKEIINFLKFREKIFFGNFKEIKLKKENFLKGKNFEILELKIIGTKKKLFISKKKNLLLFSSNLDFIENSSNFEKGNLNKKNTFYKNKFTDEFGKISFKSLDKIFLLLLGQSPFGEFNKKNIGWKTLNFSDGFQIKFNIYE